MDYRKVDPPPLFKIRPPKGAPNVVIVLMDQSCYADPQMFGGRIRTPTLERLAKNGLTYTNFKVNAACSPTRASLLTGRNSHQNSTATVSGHEFGLSRRHRRAAAQRLDDWHHAPELGLLHRLLRQEQRGAGCGGERQRPIRPMADAQRLRQVLRLHRWRAVELLPEPNRRCDLHWHAARGGLSLQPRHDQQGHRLDAGDALTDARSALPHVLRRRARATLRIRRRPTGSRRISTRVSSTTAGTSSGKPR